MCIVIVEPDKKQQVQQKYKELSAEYSDADIEFAEEERIFASVGNSEKAYLVSMKKQPKASEGEDLTDDK